MTQFIDSPIIIGGTGGSGTRAVQTIIEKAGVFMGTNLNASKDAMDFEPLLDSAINKVLTVTHGLNYAIEDLPKDLVQSVTQRYQDIATQFRKDIPNAQQQWGWKNPRSIYLLPLIYAVFPDLRYVHVVRDGRYMAFSDNQNQLRKHYEALFAKPVDMSHVSVESIKLWSQVNHDSALWASQQLGDRYIRIHLEQLLANPNTTIPILLEKLEIPFSDLELLTALIKPREQPANWDFADSTLQKMVEDEGRAVLVKLGYLS